MPDIFKNRFPYLLMFLSGFAGLGYEMVWVRALSAGLGHEIISVLAVVAAFFVGTAAGAWLLDRPIRLSQNPGRWYAAMEAVIALWAVALSVLIPRVATMGADLMGVQPSFLLHWGVTFLLPLALLLPATMAMGATLPAMECMAARMRQQVHLVGGLYGANTLGAVAGTLAATFWIVPSLGFRHTQWCLAAVNLVCAMCIMGLYPGHRHALREPATDNGGAPVCRRLLVVLFFTGLLGIGYEVMTVRILSQVLENTVFSYTVLLAVYLLGTAAGAAFYQRCLVGRDSAKTSIKRLSRTIRTAKEDPVAGRRLPAGCRTDLRREQTFRLSAAWPGRHGGGPPARHHGRRQRHPGHPGGLSSQGQQSLPDGRDRLALFRSAPGLYSPAAAPRSQGGPFPRVGHRHHFQCRRPLSRSAGGRRRVDPGGGAANVLF